VCAVIVHHHGRRLLERCLEALLASEGVDLEIVVVANACDEPLPRVVDSAPEVHVIESSRAIGFSAANNLGASWCGEALGGSDFFFFVNNDTVVEPSTLRRLADALDEAPERAVAGPRLMIWGAESTLNSLGLNVTRTGEAWDEGIGRPLGEYEPVPRRSWVLAVTGAALMIRETAYDALQGWDEIYGFYYEDIDLCLRARARGWEVVLAGDAVMLHAISATAARGSDMKRQLSWRNRFILMLVHWPWSALLTAGGRAAWSEAGLLVRRARARAWPDARLQLRSWLGVVRRLPRVASARRRARGDRAWVSALRPHGSVPPIVLPELPEEAALDQRGAGVGAASSSSSPKESEPMPSIPRSSSQT
jgi:GT2 family glycosyltransferase